VNELLGVMADTHDNLAAIRKAVEYFNQRGVKQVLHAGDYIAPFSLGALANLKCNLIGVWGNNDGEKIFLLEKAAGLGFRIFPSPYRLQLNGREILLMHEPYELEALIHSQCYDIIVYGHLHKSDLRRLSLTPEKTTLIINPGECGGWLTRKSTIGLIDLKTLQAQIVTL